MHYLINYSCHLQFVPRVQSPVYTSPSFKHLHPFKHPLLRLHFMNSLHDARFFGNAVLTDFFFYEGFLSRTLTTHRPPGEGKGTSFILIYHFCLLMNMQTFNCNFACKMTISNYIACIYQTAA